MTTETTTATETAKPAPKRQIKAGGKPKPRVKAKPTAKATKPKAPTAPAVNPHMEAGVDAKAYAGLSSFLNAQRPVKVMLRDSRPTGSMTERMQKTLYAMRNAYGSKHFAAKGWDNGALRDLAAAGLISLSGGIDETINGKTYKLDGDKPVQVMVNKAGQTYGKAS